MLFNGKLSLMPPWGGKEKRKHPRIIIPSLLEYAVFDHPLAAEGLLPGVLYNLSAGGLKFGGNSKLGIFDKVLLKLNISEFTSQSLFGKNGIFEAVAEITNIESIENDSFKYGVRFLDIRKGDVAVINELIEKISMT
jgi:hypothetical protein